MLPPGLEIKIENQPKLVELLIRVFARDVLVFVVGIDSEMPSRGEKTADIERGGRPFFVLTLIEDFSAEIGCPTVRADGEPAFQLHSVAIAPGELFFSQSRSARLRSDSRILAKRGQRGATASSRRS